MSEKDSHPIRNGIIATVSGGIILMTIPALRKPIFKALYWIWSDLVWIWNILLYSYPIPGWVLLVISILSFVGAINNIYFLIRPKNEPEYKKYTEDFLYGAKWRWAWVGDKIANLWCFCPTCDAQLVYDDSSCRIYSADVKKTDFICETCGNQVVTSITGGNRSYAVSAAEREILRRIRRNEYNCSNN